MNLQGNAARRRHGRSLAVAVAVACASACSPPLPPAGVTLDSGVPLLVWKLCDRVVGQVTVAEYDRDPGKGKVVLALRLEAGAKGAKSLPLQAKVPGYHVDQSAPLNPSRRYTVASAKDSRGTNILASAVTFSPAQLRPGSLLNEDGAQVDLARWLSHKGPDCH